MNWTLQKWKTFAFFDTVETMKRPATEWEKMFGNHLSHKAFISRMHKEFLKLNDKKIQN